MVADAPPPPSRAKALAALKACASMKGCLTVHPRCQADLRREEFDIVSACELVADCDDSEIRQSEPDDDPTRNDWIMVLRIQMEDDDLYVKVALHRPDMKQGYFLSFKTWID